jgi:broad specificity phosphatase PhoE
MNTKTLSIIFIAFFLGIGATLATMNFPFHTVRVMEHKPEHKKDVPSQEMHKEEGHMAGHYMQHADPAEAKLIDALKMGGYVLFMRHERTELDKTADDQPLNFADCASQRELSPAGVESAKEIGAAMKNIGITVSKVYASPYCRTVDTATYALGKPEVVMKLSGLAQSTDVFDMEKVGVYLKEFMSGLHPKKGENIGISAHFGNMKAAYGIHVHEGDMAVFQEVGGVLTHVGTIHPASWSDYVHDAERAKSAMMMQGEHKEPMHQ